MIFKKNLFLSLLISITIVYFFISLKEVVEKDIKGKNIIFFIDNVSKLSNYSDLILRTVKGAITKITEESYFENTLVNFEIWHTTAEGNISKIDYTNSIQIFTNDFKLKDDIITRFLTIIDQLRKSSYPDKDNFVILFSNFNSEEKGSITEIEKECSLSNSSHTLSLSRIFPVILPTEIFSSENFKKNTLTALQKCVKEKVNLSYIILQKVGNDYKMCSSMEYQQFNAEKLPPELPLTTNKDNIKHQTISFLVKEIFKEIQGLIRLKTVDFFKLISLVFVVFFLYMFKNNNLLKHKPLIWDYISLPFLIICFLFLFIDFFHIRKIFISYYYFQFIFFIFLFLFIFYCYHLLYLLLYTKVIMDIDFSLKKTLAHLNDLTSKNAFFILTILALMFLSSDPKVNFDGKYYSVLNILKGYLNFPFFLCLFLIFFINNILETKYFSIKSTHFVKLNFGGENIWKKILNK